MFNFTPWARFRVAKDAKMLRQWLGNLGKAGRDELRRGIKQPPKTGRFYGAHQASAPGEYPANKTGQLYRSVKSRLETSAVSIGSTIFYGRFLADGTRKMLPRRMSKDALETVIPPARAKLRGWMGFERR